MGDGLKRAFAAAKKSREQTGPTDAELIRLGRLALEWRKVSKRYAQKWSEKTADVSAARYLKLITAADKLLNEGKKHG